MLPPLPLNILYSSECCKCILPFLLNLKPLFYSENQIRQTAMTAAASMVVAATAETTKLETILGAQEEIATHHDQMHITQEKVITSCRCAIHSSCHLQAAYIHGSFSSLVFTSSLYNSDKNLSQNLSQTLCHLSSFHRHFSFLTFKLSLDCY